MANRESAVSDRVWSEATGPLVEAARTTVDLADALARLRPIGEPLSTMVVDRTLRVVAVSRGFVQICGVADQRQLGRTPQQICQRLADLVESPCRRVLDTGQPLRNLNVSTSPEDDSQVGRSWLVDVSPVIDQDATLGVVLLAWETTDAPPSDSVEPAPRSTEAAPVPVGNPAETTTERTQQRLGLLAEVSARLAEADTGTEQLTVLTDLLLDSGFCRWCTVFVPNADGVLYRHTVRTVIADLVERAEGMVGNVLEPLPERDPRMVAWKTGRCVVAGLADPTGIVRLPPAEFRRALTGEAAEEGNVLSVPLAANGQRHALLLIWRAREDGAFSLDDQRFMEELGHRAAIAMGNLSLLAEQTRLATGLQKTLLPDQLPTIAGVELGVGYLAAERAAEVGGDFYDVFQVDEAYALVIGDIAGRGIGAAGLAGVARTTLRALAGQLPPAAILARLNALVAERTAGERFLTLAYLLLTPCPGGASLRVWLAGHPQPVLGRPDGSIVRIGEPGPLLGVFRETNHTERAYWLAPGDMLLLYTDGLVESRGIDELFGEDRLVALMPELIGQDATTAVHRVREVITEYRSGSQFDDTAFLAVRITPSTGADEYVLFDQSTPATADAVEALRRRIGDVLTPALAPERAGRVLASVDELLGGIDCQYPEPSLGVSALVQPGAEVPVLRVRATAHGRSIQVTATTPAAEATSVRTDDVVLAETGWCETLEQIEDMLSRHAGEAGHGQQVQLRLRCLPTAAGAARRAVEIACRHWRLNRLRQTAMLVISELVSNAIRHAGTDLHVGIGLRSGQLCLSVRDGSNTPPWLRGPDPSPSTSEHSNGGRGLHLVEACTTAWGYNATSQGKTVWATMAVDGPELAAVAAEEVAPGVTVAPEPPADPRRRR